MIKLFSILFILGISFSCVSQPVPVPDVITASESPPTSLTNFVTINWEYPDQTSNTTFIVWWGSASQEYTTNVTSSRAPFPIPVGWLYPGTNFITVTASENWGGTNAVVSDFSTNEVKVIRKPSFRVWVSTYVQSSTNLLSSWSKPRKAWLFPINDIKPHEFFKSELSVELVATDTVTITH